jgi:hypothetical protein
MSHRSSGQAMRLATLALLTCGVLDSLLLAGCASAGSQPAVYTDNAKAKAQKPCPSQTPGSPPSGEACKKPQ